MLNFSHKLSNRLVCGVNKDERRKLNIKFLSNKISNKVLKFFLIAVSRRTVRVCQQHSFCSLLSPLPPLHCVQIIDRYSKLYTISTFSLLCWSDIQSDVLHPVISSWMMQVVVLCLRKRKTQGGERTGQCPVSQEPHQNLHSLKY